MQTVGMIANLLIVVGYVLVPFLWLPYLPLTRPVLLSGVGFFFTCAMTHVAMAFGFEHTTWMVLNHIAQAAFVLFFVVGFAQLLRRAKTYRAWLRGDPLPGDRPGRSPT